jgi:hypothetical protein
MDSFRFRDQPFLPSLLERAGATSQAVLAWLGIFNPYSDNWDERVEHVRGWSEHILGVMACEGMKVLGNLIASHVIVCESSDLGFNPNRGPGSWREVHKNKSARRFFEAQTGPLDSSFPLLRFLKAMESLRRRDSVAFAAEIRTVKVEAPESMIAGIWNECLGARAIPFDPAEREACIADGRKHPELKRHIEAWEELKRTGSKWVTGEEGALGT